MRSIDLHIHSVYSDGTYTPTELVSSAKEMNLSAISITDHDTIDGLAEGKTRADVLDMRFINGVEIGAFACANDKKVNIHVLGYLFNPSIIRAYMAKLKTIRDQHNSAIMAALRTVGIDMEYADMDRHTGKNTITRLHFAKALVQKGYAETVKDALTQYLHKGGSAYVEYSAPPFSEVTQAIHDAGGITSLAHPAQYKLSPAETECLIKSLINSGLEAIECMHPSQDAPYTQKMIRLAKRHGLAVTGGSDFHGNREEGIDLGVGRGEMFVPENFLAGLGVR